ncbi:hypothetical protein BJ684DRAFT_10773 [Piptocephalis cylindrospora]|uniref:Citrate transporter-like domain-containing protein n=1 Tax=Piptocephalis cylindrospora TaxID=1907219 RepID=A0A4P9Y2F7_9FUNG|nr:hypothetical protein BJ684DRAFT_10773 [Piptocephalis cylindrospora]|eukprot:RKP12953.1 hypothetical protein BJ684DRAFT_10773 [Piptocephalis cylindrospora]
MIRLDFRSWIVLVLFLFTAICINAPQTIPIPWIKGRRHFTLNLVTAPVLAVILALATTAISPAELWRGIAGSDGIEPYAILVLLISLSWVCISLDMTGALAMSALWVAKLGGRSGRRFYTVIYGLSFVYGVVTNVDVAVLTLTPIAIYFAEAMKLQPYAFLLGEFFASNISSMIFFMGNLNNIIVAQAYNLTFVTYAAWMVLPALGAGLCSWAILMVQYRREIPREVDPPVVRPLSALKEPRFAVTGTLLLLGMTVALAVSSLYHVSVWMVTLPFGVVGCVIDVLRDGVSLLKMQMLEEEVTMQNEEGWKGLSGKRETSSVVILDDPGSENGVIGRLYRRGRKMMEKFPVTSEVLVRLPYDVFPFSLGMFILVEGLSAHGWTVRLAKMLVYCCPNPTVAAFAVGYISALASIPFNNIPMTILFARALKTQEFAGNVSETTSKAAFFALAIGADLGANLTVSAGLSGLLWSTLSQAKGVRFVGWKFFRACIYSFPPTVAVACGILAAEIAVMG